MARRQSIHAGFIERIHEIVQENLYNDNFGTQQLADKLGLSRSSLHRQLKETAGYSASQIIRKIRLNKAMEMLKTSTANMTEVAFECGFHSLSYFTKCFREEFGYTPGKVRSEAKEAIKESHRSAVRTKNQLFSFPVQATSFVGRKNEMRIIDQLLSDHRLITLVGPGGSGKTRLVCETLSNTRMKYPDGIWFVDLAPLERGELVSRRILETFQIPEIPGMDHSDLLKLRLKEKSLLIILDNCEHVLDGCRSLVGNILSASHSLRILATSRERFRIPEEEIFRVSPLSLVDPGTINLARQARQSEAVLLFEDRARKWDNRFELVDSNAREVSALCQKVDGFPLALEIVASRMRYMDPHTMLDRISGKLSEISLPDADVVERHRTLHATIDWSFSLLSEKEKMLFKRLSIFSRGFDLEAAEEICTDEFISAEEILDLLSNLLDRSMIYTLRSNEESFRYNLLETLQQYASRQISESDLSQLVRNHERYYVSLAEKAYAERLTAQSYWMVKLQREHHNLLSVLFRSESENPDLHRSLASFLAWFWSRSNNYTLARKVMEKILVDENTPKDVLARIYTGYAKILNVYPGRQDRAIHMFEKGADLWSELGRSDEKAVALADLAVGFYGFGEDKTGLRIAEEAYETAQFMGDKAIILYCMLPLSQGYVNLKKFEEARSVAEKIIKAGEELKHLYAQFVGHHNTGDCALMQEKYREAESEYGQGIEICQSYGDFIYTCVDLSGVAMAVAGQGRFAKALRLVEAVNKISEDTGMMSPEDIPMKFWQEQIEKNIRRTREQLGVKLARQYKEEGRLLSLEQAVEYALDFEKD
ncbi:MAG: helix-turn-helix domain-containing protein [Bacteroidales bacterium]|nr:helix-turn-helix domain-containing protein [Bacteroidales bacterium]